MSGTHAVAATGRLQSPELVFGWDAQDRSLAALEFAVALSDRLDARLHVVHVAASADTPVDPDGWDWEQDFERHLDEDATRGREILAQLGKRWTYRTAFGDPAAEIHSLADQFDAVMIVLGGPHAGGVAEFLGGLAGQSVSRQLTHHEGRPVLIVPDRDPGEREGRRRG